MNSTEILRLLKNIQISEKQFKYFTNPSKKKY